VPEVWRFDGKTIEVLQLDSDGKYTVAQRSRCFPQVPLNDIVKFLNDNAKLGETLLFRALRQWVRDQIARGWKTES
jgi:hypothetical protein